MNPTSWTMHADHYTLATETHTMNPAHNTQNPCMEAKFTCRASLGVNSLENKSMHWVRRIGKHGGPILIPEGGGRGLRPRNPTVTPFKGKVQVWGKGFG